MPFRTANLLEIFTTLFSCTKQERRIKRHFSRKKNRYKRESKQPIIYVDAIQTPNTLIALSYFLPVIQSKTDSKIRAYRHIEKKSFNLITHRLRHFFSVLRKLGVAEIHLFKHESIKNEEILIAFSEVKTKEDLENLKFHDIYIGDLVYDSYMNETRRPTIDFADPSLFKIFAKCLAMVILWEQKFRSEEISAVCVSHTVYSSGIPARVAIRNNIDVFQITSESIYRMNSSQFLAHQDHHYYPEEFSTFSAALKSNAHEMAKAKLDERLSGELTSDLFYMPISAFQRISGTEKKVLKSSSRKKILIATHDFYDSPHCFGNSLYTDFYEWLNALGDISNQTNFDWYIKNHPYMRGDGEEVVNLFLERFPNITLVPPATSHHQLIEEGISAVMTVFGSVALEYAYLGIQVVNACPTNPHFRYNFSSSPNSVNEYIDAIRNLEDKEVSIDVKEVLEYYYMHFLNYPQNWVFLDYDLYLKSTSGEGRKSLLKTYKHFLKSENLRSDSDIKNSIQKFLEGAEYKFRISS